MHIRAGTFDFWNTLYTDERSAQDDVSDERLDALRQALEVCGVSPADEDLVGAYRSGFEAYLLAWRAGRHFGATEQVKHVLATLGATAQDGIVRRTALRIEELGDRASLRLLPGVREAIPVLAAQGVRLGLISDTGLTPGRVLRRFLARDGLSPHFAALTFSDETGYPKPDRRMFADTLEALGAGSDEAAHVGDTPRTDIAGARDAGMIAIRFAAVHDLPDPPPAHAVIRDHRDLPALLARFGRARRQGA